MAADESTELPIFELPVVLLPSEQLPLHIFEERYKRMVGRCLETGEPFGVVFRDDSGARATGCTAKVIDVLERFEDGRMNIVVGGEEPFRVLDRYQATDYPAARVETIDTGRESDAGPEQVEPARRAFAELLEAAEATDPDEAAQGDAYGLAARIEMPVAIKQKLLETRSEASRLTLLTRALRRLADSVRRSRAVAELARSNGRGLRPQ